MKDALPQCRKCRNFFITYDPAKPYGCRAMGFKSRRMPSVVVYETSGMICQLFEARPDPDGRGGQSTTRTA